MVINNYRPVHKEVNENKKRPFFKWILFGVFLLLVGFAVAFVIYEVRNSKIQAREISRYAASLTYNLEEGPQDAVKYPLHGPFDARLGYVYLPQMLDRAKLRGMKISYQTKFSPALIDYTSHGFFVPYQEKIQTGLNIVDYLGKPIYKFSYPRRVYPDFKDIPSLVVESLLFIENRELLNKDKPFMNPAVDWKRFTRATMQEAAKSIGFDYKTIGGSTLPTQIEKYRHSPAGITIGPKEKILQMVSASVRAYQNGPETLPARKAAVVSYLNTVPLSGAPGYGEVHGLGDGLWVWFGADFNEVNEVLSQSETNTASLLTQGQALRQVLSLMIAQRRPSYYLSPKGCAELNELTGSYLRLLSTNGYISSELKDASLQQEVTFRDFGNYPAVAPLETDKGALMVRTHLSGLLGKPLYDLDRMDLAATSTLQNDLQKQLSTYLNRLSDPEFAGTVGVLGDRMLSANTTDKVLYSFTLIESTPQGNMVRVQTDNNEQPFDINEGSKLELGSTAKLRVLVTYLEVIAEIHKQHAALDTPELRKKLKDPQDNLTRWVVQYLLTAKDKSLDSVLQAALQRRYSANPWEMFFTGGGMHTFHNYRNEDNRSRPTVHEAFLKSINLPFVRIMRDIVRYSTNQNIGSRTELLGNDKDPRRKDYLVRFADKEGKTFLLKFWRKYKGLNEEERFEKFISGLWQDPVRMAVAHRYLYPQTDSVSFAQFLRVRLPNEKITDDRVSELYHRYGPEAYNLPDQGYIARAHPLEMWLLSFMLQNPDTDWSTVVEESRDERQEVYTWLFRTRFKNARDSRIGTMLEIEAFMDIHQRWEKLGYPFSHLVPSFATALGSSGDRPEALAELMGIIMNNGRRQRTLRIEGLHFASQTPYEAALKWKPVTGEQVLLPEVATAVRQALSEVVDAGTARRLQGGFKDANGEDLVMGGKTGTGDNRMVTLTSRGQRISSRAVNRTATFVFFLGDKYYGTLTAFVPGKEAANFSFTSSLPVQVLKGMAPIIEPYITGKSATNSSNLVATSAINETKQDTVIIGKEKSNVTLTSLKKVQAN